MPTTTELTEKYISEHPSIKDCLKKNIINYSKLSRIICEELGIEKKMSMEAVLVACRRYSEKLKKEKVLEDKIIKIVKKGELEIKNKVVVAIIEKKMYLENLMKIEKKIREKADLFYAIEGTTAFTIVTSEKYLDDIKQLFKYNIIKINKDMALITIMNPKEIEDTPGVVAYFYSLFADNGINVSETMSCWTDTMFVVAQKDIAKVMQAFSF